MKSTRDGPDGRGRGESPAPRPRGFTIVELMVALSVLAILLALAVPSFTNATLGARLSSYANDLLASTQLARSEAIKRNREVRLCAAADPVGTDCATSGTWHFGWIVWTTQLIDGVEERVVLQRQQAVSPEFRVIQTAEELSFPPTVVGVTPDNVSFRVCRANPAGSQRRIVTVTASGSASVRAEDGGCT